MLIFLINAYLVENFGSTGPTWASMGLEAYWWMPRAYIPYEKYQTWKALNMTWMT
jgi:hypothetical protein